MRTIAVVLAGGSGRRMGTDVPKQFLELGGRKVLEYSVSAFQQNSLIDEIAIVCASDYKKTVEEMKGRLGWTKVARILQGGNERYESSLSAINSYSEEGVECNLLFHDAARPLVSQEIISAAAKALESCQALTVAVPATDTIVRVQDGIIAEMPQRRFMYCEQTPQGFRLSVIREAYARALKDPDFVSTDDCGTVLHYMPEVEVHIVEGERKNQKITYKEDISALERYL